MWLLPALSTIAKLALRVFYRFRVDGPPVPPTGPVLLVANHPNSLLDPGAVSAAAGRPVRFMAKAPLFSDPRIGWLVRAAGAIPVYRRTDDASQMARNEDSFQAVFDALHEGAAVGIFPEGMSHSEPSLAPMKTGAARLALGAADGVAFPIVPLGLSLQEKGRFRSAALALTGTAVQWSHLAARGPHDPMAVRELTARIEEALRAVTVNLQDWEDAPLVEVAQEVYLAEEGLSLRAEARIAGSGEVAAGLAHVREAGDPEAAALVREVRRHARILDALGIRPHQLVQPDRTQAFRWGVRTLATFLVAAPVLVAGTLVFAAPVFLVRAIASNPRLSPDLKATYKLLGGAVIHLFWIAFLSSVVWWRVGATAGLLASMGLPLLGIATVAVTDWRRAAGGAVRRFLIRRRRAEMIQELRARQKALAARLREMRAALP
ncbi:MAG: 1-acyl-sn-glycerol-3-phosphate acyltransferase [Gemmatimonadetes bacterium]|nr:1-acyl-sn-glycerol-3-phosphate acyltransferase [Gemmatimonadota bacterium]